MSGFPLSFGVHLKALRLRNEGHDWPDISQETGIPPDILRAALAPAFPPKSRILRETQILNRISASIGESVASPQTYGEGKAKSPVAKADRGPRKEAHE